MSLKLLLTLALGAGVRLWLFQSPPLTHFLSERNELVTPLTSWKRMTEGLALHRSGVSPYAGDIYHDTPLMLRVMAYLDALIGVRVYLLFIIIDVLLAVVLDAVARHIGTYLLRKQSADASHFTSEKLLLRAEAMELTRFYVVAAYMLNPLGVFSCVARSTGIITNLFIALGILFALKGSRIRAAAFVAAAAYQSLYPIMLVVPIAIHLAWEEAAESAASQLSDPKVAPRGGTKPRESGISNASAQTGTPAGLMIVSVIQTTICTLSALALMLYASYHLENDAWDFAHSTYGFILSVPDLSPNIGVFWYFFTEMFDHFRVFFLCVFQMHAFIYVVPLTFRLHRDPMFLAYILIALTAIFKSYPSYTDVAFYLSLLPLWRAEVAYMRNCFVVTVMFCVGVVLAPVLWHLWIQTGTANANFYFAITLVLSTAQIFLVTDLLFAFLRRQYDLTHGVGKLTADGKPVPVVLQ